MESLLQQVRAFGIGRVVAILGASAGVAAILIAMMLRVGGEPKALLYANLDLKEAGQITGALDGAGIKYELKGDGSTIFVDRNQVASARLMLSGKGLPTSGSVGYEIFDSAPALGQTDFVQQLNRQRALEGELARTIRAIQGVQFVRVHLAMPRRELFQQDSEAPSASVFVTTGARGLSAEQVRAIRNLVSGAVPDMKAERVAVMDGQGELLAGEGDASPSAGGAGQRNEVEERLRRTVKDIVEGVVGPGKARVQVTADLDLSRVTLQEEKFDPEGQVVRSTQTSTQNAKELKPATAGQVSASQNVPSTQASGTASDQSASTSGQNEETTNYEISRTTRTEIQEPGRIKRLSVAVAVDGITAPGKGGKPGPYTPRSAQEMQRIEQLVRSAVGADDKRGDQVQVVNVRFDHGDLTPEGVSAASALNFDKNDIMRGVELAVLLVVAALLILFVVRPLFRATAGMAGPGGGLLAGPALAAAGQGASVAALTAQGYSPEAAQQLALASNPSNLIEQRIDIARIEGQVKASSVKQVAEFVEKHPEESVSILRSWLHER